MSDCPSTSLPLNQDERFPNNVIVFKKKKRKFNPANLPSLSVAAPGPPNHAPADDSDSSPALLASNIRLFQQFRSSDRSKFSTDRMTENKLDDKNKVSSVINSSFEASAGRESMIEKYKKQFISNQIKQTLGIDAEKVNEEKSAYTVDSRSLSVLGSSEERDSADRWLTGISEVDIPITEKLANIKRTQAAAAVVTNSSNQSLKYKAEARSSDSQAVKTFMKRKKF
jgi:hypothetical protein